MNVLFATAVRYAFALLLASPFGAGPGGIQETVRWDFELVPETARPGESVSVRLTAEIEPDWYVYAHTLTAKGPIATRFKFDLPDGVTAIGAIEAPEPEVKYDEGFEVNVQIYHDKVTFEQRLLLNADLQTTAVSIAGSVRFQTCSGTKCLPPKTVPFNLTLAIEEGAVRDAYKPPEGAAKAAPTPPDSTTGPASSEADTGTGSSKLEQARQSGLFVFLLFAIAQGFVALLTPCVYPMIPITISFFLRQGEQEGRKPFLLASTYAGSIIVTFALVGMLLAALIGPAGTRRFAASVFANAFLGILFIAFALNLFGMFEIRVPTKLQNYLSGKGRGGGYTGTVFMGLAFTLASLTCTAPFIGALLGYSATGDWFWPLAGMLGFAFAFALPFFFLALFPQYLASMPKSGGWLNSVKVVMGFLVLAVALKFISNVDAVRQWGVFSHSVVLAAWVTISIFAGLYLLGKIRLPHDSPVDGIGVPRMILSMVFLTFGLYLSTGLFGGRLSGAIDTFLPAPEEGYVAAAGMGQSMPHQAWIDNFDEALARAKAEQKPIFVDFSGVTCTNCKKMERTIFPVAEVQNAFQNFVLARLMTDTGPYARENEKLQIERFNTVALPLYAVISPDDKILARFEGLTKDPVEFAAFLEKGLAAYAAQ